MSNWINIDPDELTDLVHDATIGGVTLRVHIHPNDIPVAVRGDEQADGSFKILLRYADDEAKGPKQFDSFIAEVGKHTGRLYSILIPKSGTSEGDRVRLELVPQIFDTLRASQSRLPLGRKSHKPSISLPNFEATQHVVNSKSSELFAGTNP